MHTYKECHLERDLEKKRLISMRRTFLSEKARNDEVMIDFARTPADMERTFRLVRERYCEAGYLCPKRHGLWLTVYHALPETRVLVAHPKEDARELLITATIVHDSPIGLPSENLYSQEILQLKDKGRKVAEVCSLARARHQRADYSFMKMIRTIVLYGFACGADDCVISVNPNHAAFYLDYLLFEQVGEVKQYPGLTNAAAVLLRLNLDHYKQKLQDAYRKASSEYNLARYFFDSACESREYDELIKELTDFCLKSNGIPVWQLYSWLQLETDIWQQISEKQRGYLDVVYPGLKNYFLSRMS